MYYVKSYDGTDHRFSTLWMANIVAIDIARETHHDCIITKENSTDRWCVSGVDGWITEV